MQINYRHTAAADEMWCSTKGSKKTIKRRNKRRGNSLFLIFLLCSLTLAVLKDYAHTLMLLIRPQGFDGY